MKRVLKFLSIIFSLAEFIFAGSALYAQTMPIYSFQQFSNINFNPASIPVKDYVEGTLISRHQWAGFKGSPKSQMLNFQGYVREIKSSFATTVQSEFFGPTYQLNFKGIYAYNFEIGTQYYLTLGLGAGLIYRYFDGSQIITEDEDDPAVIRDVVNDVKPDFDFGLVLSAKAFTIGLSATHLTSFLYQKNKQFFTPNWGIHAFAQYDFEIAEKHHIIPYIRAYYEGTVFQAEIQLRADLFDIFWLGAGYRFQDGLVFNCGFRIAKMVGIGYAYDFNLGSNKASLKNKGTHEIILHLRINSYKNMGESSENPRYFE
ncbi:MAG: PorP/SprF family type IX secretion system membrane protein [Bacteroidales bacterium]|jgi:type IX secretion system PorP/SprF family membrane protein|nr:PorP/SprF family type IX secretion system membrane protein [Bacteroidales bacterium]